MRGRGLVNSLINKLPFELHLPGYNYCGPGTKLEARLARGDRGVNQLDEYCKEHDIAYSRSKNLSDRHKADNILMNMAKNRRNASDATFGEKLAANLVQKVMKAKIKTGASLKKKKFKTVLSHTKKKLREAKPKNQNTAISFAYNAAKRIIKSSGNKVKVPRIIPMPKSGGFLPLLPIFAGLSAIGSIAGGAASIAKTINSYKAAKKQFDEEQRHNKSMEAIAIGHGLHLTPYKKGFGLVINKKNFN